VADVRSFGPPVNDDTIIWRYIDLEKLESLLEQSALYFASAKQFSDAFEGSITRADHRSRLRSFEQFAPDTEILYRPFSRAFQALTRLMKISCWHMNRYESVAMWQLYLREGKGVAIRSTTGRLKSSLRPFRLKPSHGEEAISLGPVSYIDYHTAEIPRGGFIAPFFHKRQSFSYEAEFRAVVSLVDAEEWGVEVPVDGILVSVDLPTLIEGIYIAPALDDTVHEEIGQLIAAYRLHVPVSQSDLDTAPVF
jgi:hypothetical protein